MLQESAIITKLPEVPQLEEEEYELDPSNPESIERFLEAVENLYIDAMQWDAVARKEGYERLQMYDVAGIEVFQVLYEIMDELQTKIRVAEESGFTDLDIEQVQVLYDKLETVAMYIITLHAVARAKKAVPGVQSSEQKQPTQEVETDEAYVSAREEFGRQRRSVLPISSKETEAMQTVEITLKQKDIIAEDTAIEATQSSQLQAEVQESDPVTKVVPMPSPGVMKPAEELDERSLTGQYLLDDEAYREFIEERYSSPQAFERLIDMRITKFEAQAVDVFERWLDEKFQSPFLFLQDKSVAEVVELSQSAEVRQKMTEAQIKYEAFVGWVDLIPEMQAVVQLQPNQAFGELVARWFIESEMSVSGSSGR